MLPFFLDSFQHFLNCHVQAIRNSEKGGKARPSLALLNQSLVQFGAHRGLQGSHIGGHIVYFYNVSAGEREVAWANVWGGSDGGMGPGSGLAYRGVPREGSQSGVGGVHGGSAESVGAVAQGASPTHRDRAH